MSCMFYCMSLSRYFILLFARNSIYCTDKLSTPTPKINIYLLSINSISYVIFSVSVERWCRLRGNLLFYFKSRDHWSEPAGVIVIEDAEVTVETNSMESTFGIILTFGGGKKAKYFIFSKKKVLSLVIPYN